MNGFPIFDIYEDEMEYYAKQEQKELPSKLSQTRRNPPPTKRSAETIEHSIEPALLGGEEGGKTSWVIRDFLAEGACVLLAAEAGSGKTTLIYSAAEAIQSGCLFMGELPVEQGKVLVIQGDEPANDARTKFRRMDLEAKFEVAYLDEQLNISWLAKQVRSQRYKAVFIDSATSVLATNDLEVTDLVFSRKLYEIGKISAVSGVAIAITCHLNKPSENQTRKMITKHDISGVSTMGAAVSDLWGVWRDPNPCWDSHFNLVCLGKRNCKEGTIWRLEGSDEDYSWILKETGDDGLLPQARILLEDKIVELLTKHKEPLSIKEIAEKLQTKYEYTRRCCTELFDQGRIKREKVRTQKQGRPKYQYSV